MSALDVIVRRHDAYNAHDLDAFLSAHANDVVIATHPDTVLGRGREHLTMLFEDRFSEGVVSVDRRQAIEADAFVVTHEVVDYGDHTVDYVVLYEVRDDLIRSVSFLRD